MYSISEISALIEQGVADAGFPEKPAGLYNPARYILSAGGKRIRPLLSMLGSQVFTDDLTPHLPVALAMEVFHNFTLVHDDIMDNAPVRRGQPTVHEKWDVHTAILSGDAMMIQSYVLLSSGPSSRLADLLAMFNRTALEVCEGQQDDMDFEKRQDVQIDEYLTMIAHKTSVLLGCSLYCGAISAGASEQDAMLLYESGLKLGISFQIQDDILDTYGDSATFGKKVGGDIIQNKKTFLYLTVRDQATGDDAEALRMAYSSNPADEDTKITAVKALFDKYQAREQASAVMARFYEEARAALSLVNAPKERLQPLFQVMEQVYQRNM